MTHKNAEDLSPNDVVDGIKGRVKILECTLRPRKDMVPLVILLAENGEQMRFESGSPVPVYL